VISIVAPGIGARVGPGLPIFYSISAGPIPVDDFVELSINDPISGNVLALGDVITAGILTGHVITGVSQKGLNGLVGVLLAGGAGCSSTVSQFHANGTLVQTSAAVTGVWDPVSAVWALFSASHGDLAQILAAVTHTFPTTS
jgi:hypothetical protein